MTFKSLYKGTEKTALFTLHDANTDLWFTCLSGNAIV